ncbi:DHH family phosphoesterase [Candidatus Woesearchaeota archaeon]|nr:DHH family phosphoesterase [Candidatus Woesearchaeota archaeon]
MKYQAFRQEIRKAVERFRGFDKSEVVRIVSHLDADGICACSILIKALNQEDRKYSISIVKQLTENTLREYITEQYKLYFFTDLGSGQIELISKYLKDRSVFILDHHQFNKDIVIPDFIVHVNPHMSDIDGNSEISGSGVVFYFAKELNKENEELAHIAVVGAIGDIQEKKGFSGLNKEILDIAVKRKKLTIEKGVRWFGVETKPLHKLLAYSTDPYIPDISGSPSRAIQFLKNLDIAPKIENKWKMFDDLTGEEKQKLISAIIIKRAGEKNPEDILGDKYILTSEEKSSPTRDAREFSTLLNACGRLERASLGIGTCLNDKRIKQKAISCLGDYKREIVSAMRWCEENIGSTLKDKPYIILNAKDNIRATIIGTVASILSNSKDLKPGTFIMTIAQLLDKTTKVSLRIAGNVNNIDLRKIVQEIVEKTGGESGGHKNAAGAIINTKDEDKFIKEARVVLNSHSLEEVVT